MDSSTNFVDLTAVDSPGRSSEDPDNPALPSAGDPATAATPPISEFAWSDDSTYDADGSVQPPTTAEILVSLLQSSQETARALAMLAGELRADRDYREYRIHQTGRPSRQVDVADAPMSDPPAAPATTRPAATRVRIKDEPDTAAPATPSADAKTQSTSATSAPEALATPPLPPRTSNSFADDHADIQAAHKLALHTATHQYAHITTLGAAVNDGCGRAGTSSEKIA